MWVLCNFLSFINSFEDYLLKIAFFGLSLYHWMLNNRVLWLHEAGHFIKEGGRGNYDEGVYTLIMMYNMSTLRS